ncbi:MAG: MBL fold metallo-hydrolase [Sandaracinaceae bacterium]|nr:MBL fold metallo-hydrolase [Myxococcales bacterium]MCB9658470.1 MBL fold metallo-hydrolase [Sandaracinaceae bacterium]
MIEIEFLGAAQGVTGSMHLVHTPQGNVLLDCGLFQGRRKESVERNRNLRVDPREVDVAVLSHAHIDHSGALPVLYKAGYRGAIYATEATTDLCSAMLEDAAAIQKHDAEWINGKVARGTTSMDPVEPLYEQAHVDGVMKQMVATPYHEPRQILPGVTLTFFDAGHVLGSAIVVLDIDDEGDMKRVVFTGDLGRHAMPILRDPELPHGANVLLMESTYGDRLHPPRKAMEDDLARIVEETVARRGKVVIPSFALERAQEILYTLRRLLDAGRLPEVPVYLDSPLALKVTDVFRRHPGCYDDETAQMLANDGSPFNFPGLRYVESVRESMDIDANREPCIIIAASGMCEFGRVVHHLKAIVEDPNSVVVIVGFMAQHTLGRRLVERRPRVRILGVEWQRSCRVEVLEGFSAHADQRDLLAFAEKVRTRGQLRQVALVHGELTGLRALEHELRERQFPSVAVPAEGDVLRC